MASLNYAQSTRSSLFLDLGTLASATYITSTAIDFGTTIPVDLTLEIVVDPNGSPTGNKQLLVFAKYSLDGTNYGSGPESGTTATNEPDLDLVGFVACEDTSEHRKLIRLFNGKPPIARYAKLVVKNDMGVALTSGGVYTAEIVGDIA